VKKMRELTARQKKILSLIIHEHIRSAEPVGSSYLVQKYRLGLSSATIRNEMAALTEAGLLRQPHTSAGRVPTEEGYRYFVGQLMRETSLPDEMRHTISHQFSQVRNDMKQWMQLAASVLANQTHAASLVTAPQPAEACVKHLELISTHGRQLLAVLVLEGGQIHQNILTLEEPISQDQLSILSNKMTQIFSGKNLSGLRAFTGPLSWPGQSGCPPGKFTCSASPMCWRNRNSPTRKAPAARCACWTSAPFCRSSSLRVQVLIGGEGIWDDLRQCSVILSKYGSPGIATGTLGILGPMRMSYGHSISMVRFLTSILSDFIAEQW